MDAEKGGEQDGRREARHVTLLLQTKSCGHRQAQAGNPGPRAAGGPAEQRE